MTAAFLLAAWLPWGNVPCHVQDTTFVLEDSTWPGWQRFCDRLPSLAKDHSTDALALLMRGTNYFREVSCTDDTCRVWPK